MKRRTCRPLHESVEALEAKVLLSATVFEHNDIGYFLDGDAPALQRYDIENEQWLAPINLRTIYGDATAAAVDDDGFYVAYDKLLYRYSLDGLRQTPLYKAESAITGVFTDGNVLVASYAEGVVTFNKLTNELVTARTGLYSPTASPSVNFVHNQFYGHSVTKNRLILPYSDAGELEMFHHGTYTASTNDHGKLWVSLNGNQIVDQVGTVYAYDFSSIKGVYSSDITDVKFSVDGSSIVLDGNLLKQFSSDLSYEGYARLPLSHEYLFTNNTNAITFNADDSATGYTATITPLIDISQNPLVQVDPNNLSFKPDEVFTTTDGTLLLLDKADKSLFQYDPFTEAYVRSIPLIHAPDFLSYSPALNVAYLGYESGIVEKVDLNVSDPTSEALFFESGMLTGLAAVGKYIYASAERIGPNNRSQHAIYTSDGVLAQVAQDRSGGGKEFVWSDTRQKLYTFPVTGDTSLMSIWIDATESGDMREFYHRAPYLNRIDNSEIRLSPDESTLVAGNGAVYNAQTLEKKPTTIANSFLDAAWLDDELFTVRTLNGQTEVQHWSQTNYGLLKAVTLPGTAISILGLDDYLLVVTRNASGVPQFTYLTDQLTTPLLPDALQVTSTQYTVNESDGTLAVTVSRNRSIENSLDVLLQTSDLTVLTVPQTVTIPAGEYSVTFLATILDDAIFDDFQSAIITASASNFVADTYVVRVANDESISLTSTQLRVREDATLMLTVSRTGSTQAAIVVELENSDSNKLSVPASVTIPAGQSSLSFSVRGIDDNYGGIDQPVQITPHHGNYTSKPLDLTIEESTVPLLTIVLDETTVSENAGTVYATVTRNFIIDTSIFLYVRSSNIQAVTVSFSFTIPAGETSKRIPITVVNDSIYDRSKSSQITVSVPDFGSDEATIEVTNNDIFTLEAAPNLEEYDDVVVTLRRTGDFNRQIVVPIFNDSPQQLRTPPTVTIPAWQSSVTFIATAVLDRTVEGPTPVVLRPYADYFSSITVTVSDSSVTYADSVAGYNKQTGQWTVGLSDENGMFPFNTYKWNPDAGWDIHFGDFTGDGQADIAGRTDNGIWYVMDGAYGTYTYWGQWGTDATQRWNDSSVQGIVEVGDFNGDGIDDILGKNWRGELYVSLSTGSSFSRMTYWGRISQTGWVDHKVGDFNGDGKTDVLSVNIDGARWINESNGSGFALDYYGRMGTQATAGWKNFLIGDFNGDGADDVVQQTSYGQWWKSTFNGQADGAFITSYANRWDPDAFNDFHVGDFNGDGKDDFAARSNTNQWWINRSLDNGRMNTEYWGAWANGVAFSSTIGDFNGDGKDDIAGVRQSDGAWFLLESIGTRFQGSYYGLWRGFTGENLIGSDRHR